MQTFIGNLNSILSKTHPSLGQKNVTNIIVTGLQIIINDSSSILSFYCLQSYRHTSLKLATKTFPSPQRSTYICEQLKTAMSNSHRKNSKNTAFTQSCGRHDGTREADGAADAIKKKDQRSAAVRHQQNHFGKEIRCGCRD